MHQLQDRGEGEKSRGPTADPPQNFTDVNEGKSVGGALHLEVGGLRFGVSGMIDSATVTSGVDLSEQIGGADLHLRLGELEAIVEGAVIHHDLGGVDPDFALATHRLKCY